MNKVKAIAWGVLYLAIALAMQVLIAGALSVSQLSLINVSEVMKESSYQLDFLEKLLESKSFLVIMTSMCDVMMLVCFGLWYYFREKKYGFQPDYRSAFSKGNVVRIVLLAICGQFATELLMTGVSVVFPWMMESYNEINESFQIDTLPPVLMILIVGVIGPIAEEFLFRGMIYGRLRRAFSVWPAAIISAVAFGAFHANWVQGIYAGALGIVMAIVYEETSTIWASVLMHMLFNISSYVLEPMLQWLGQMDSTIVDILRLVFDLGCMGIVIFITWYLSTNRRRVQYENIYEVR